MNKLVEHMETVYQIECFICGETQSAEWPTETKLDFAETLKKEGWKTDDGGAMCKGCEKTRKDY